MKKLKILMKTEKKQIISRKVKYLILLIISCTFITYHILIKYYIKTLEYQLPAKPSHNIEILERWATERLSWVDKTLQMYPPKIDPKNIRIMALATMDDCLSLRNANALDFIADYYQRRIQFGLSHLQSTICPDRGAGIWKFYNFTFVVKTPNHAFAFDVCPGYHKVIMSKEQMQIIAKQIDIAFISHKHLDHADIVFAHEMAALGKKVIIPDNLWPNSDIEQSLIRVSGTYKGEIDGISFVAFPGSQFNHGEKVPNSVYLVTADGMSFMHMGDQDLESDYENWIKDIGKIYDVDILFVNCRDKDMSRKISAIEPKLIIPGHENELRHGGISLWGVVRTFYNLRQNMVPVVLMSWGEYFYYTK